jgi:hypothetical protein
MQEDDDDNENSEASVRRLLADASSRPPGAPFIIKCTARRAYNARLDGTFWGCQARAVQFQLSSDV